MAAFLTDSGLPQAFNLVVLGLLFVLFAAVTVFGILSFWLPVRKRSIEAFRRRWGATPAASDATLRQALRVLAVPSAWAAVVGGLGGTLAVLMWAFAPAVSGGPSAVGTYSVSIAFDLVWITWVAVCIGIGRLIGVAVLRARSRRVPRYADPRPRHVSLFLPRWFVPALGGWILFLVVATLVALPFLAYPYFGTPGGPDISALPLGRLSALLGPLALAVSYGVGAFVVRLFLTLPHLSAGLATPEARLVDFTVREESIYAYASAGTLVLWFLSLGQWMFLVFNLPFVNNHVFDVVIQLVTLPLVLIPFILVSVALMRYHKEAPARFYQHESGTQDGNAA